MSSVALTDDLLAAKIVADPYPYFARLRTEDPVHWNRRYGVWVISRYDDVVMCFRDERLSADRVRPTLGDDPAFEILARWMVFTDPPDHTRLRRLVQGAFTARATEAWRRRIEEIVARLLAGFAGGDLLAGFARPLPAIVIAEMMGVPPEDHERFVAWSDEVSALVFGEVQVADRHERARRGMAELAAYFRRLVAEARGRDDLLGALARAGEAGDALTEEELIATCVLLLFAGHETTRNLIANGTLALLRHRGEMDRLRDDPSVEGSAVEELLRYDGPSKMMARVAAADVELRGRTIRAGDRVLLAQAAANRDPIRFSDPDRLDLGRPDNAHVAFGSGIHLCLGAPLARLEGRIAISALARLSPRLHLATERLEWHPSLLGRGLAALPVAIA